MISSTDGVPIQQQSFLSDAYLDDPEIADLFAFLLETNDARQAAARDAQLRDVIMRPVDVEAIRSEIHRLEGDLADLPETPMCDHRDLGGEIDRLRSKRQGLNTEINELRSLIQYNEERLEAEDYELLQDGGAAAEDGSVTDQLVGEDDETVICWTCGSSYCRL